VNEQGEEGRAEVYLTEGLDIARQIGYRERAADMLTKLGTLAAGRGDYAQAEDSPTEGLALARAVEMPWLILSAHCEWGELALRQAGLAEAASSFQEVLAGDPPAFPDLAAQALYDLARVAAAVGALTCARGLGEEGLRRYEQLGTAVPRACAPGWRPCPERSTASAKRRPARSPPRHRAGRLVLGGETTVRLSRKPGSRARPGAAAAGRPDRRVQRTPGGSSAPGRTPQTVSR
jgi:hypothetical protein